jgi:hypothetical protein
VTIVSEPSHFLLKKFFAEKMLTEKVFSQPIADDNEMCWCAPGAFILKIAYFRDGGRIN